MPINNKIYVLRHFKTRYNLDNRISGQSISLSIIERQEIPCEDTFDHIFCSTAKRCKQTISCLPKSASQRVTYLDEILERNMGLLEGQPRLVAKHLYPDLFINDKFNVLLQPPLGESFQAFKKRAQSFLECCSKNMQGEILCCSHNQFIKMCYFLLNDIPITADRWNRVKYPCGKIVDINCPECT